MSVPWDERGESMNLASERVRDLMAKGNLP